MRYILFDIPTPWGHLPIMGYGAMLVLGFVCGIALAHWRARRCGENPEHVLNLGLLALLGGVVGARLLFVFGESDSVIDPQRGVLENLLNIVNVRAGGLVFYGGVMLAILFCVIYMARKRLSTRRMLDIVAPSLMLGLAFGRAGCTLNGCCWGGQCTLDWAPKIAFPFASPAFEDQASLPWRIVDEEGRPTRLLVTVPNRSPSIHQEAKPGETISGPHLTIPETFITDKSSAGEPMRGPGGATFYRFLTREELRHRPDRALAGKHGSLPVHPAQLYGIVNALLLCLVLNVFFTRRKREGQVFALMLILYPITRFVLEAIRRDTEPGALGLTMSQNISLWTFVGGLVLWWVLSRLPAVAPVPSGGISPNRRQPEAQNKAQG